MGTANQRKRRHQRRVRHTRGQDRVALPTVTAHTEPDDSPEVAPTAHQQPRGYSWPHAERLRKVGGSFYLTGAAMWLVGALYHHHGHLGAALAAISSGLGMVVWSAGLYLADTSQFQSQNYSSKYFWDDVLFAIFLLGPVAGFGLAAALGGLWWIGLIVGVVMVVGPFFVNRKS